MTRVLVVDDREDNLYYLSALLAADGCEVEVAHHGAEALAKAREDPPDLCISDLLMPVMDGYTLLRHWKKNARLSHIPFIVYTATYTTPEDEQLALNLGADAFILKPTEPVVLLARIHSTLAFGGTAAPKPATLMLDPLLESDEQTRLREYSEVLIHKLEQKTLELAESNRLLQQDNATLELSEMALRESESRFRQLAENIDDAFWLSDPLGQKVFYVSPAYEKIWGRSCQSLYDAPSSWLQAVVPEERERVKLSQQAASSGDETYRIIRPDGSHRWVRSRTNPICAENGAVYRVAGVSRDVTEYRRLEEQFRQAQKMEAVGQLAGGVAHDFNNLLSVILSYTSLVLDELSADAPIRNDIEEVHRAGERARALTLQLLAVSRQQVLQPRVLDLSQVVRDMERMLRRLLGEDIALSLRTSRGIDKVHADASQIEQILMNLAVNARDAMVHGGALTVEVTNAEFDAKHFIRHPGVTAGGYVRLSVTDTGIGMDAVTRERIFEPFFTTKEKGKGTGLGLSTVFGIVDQSGGHIDVFSEPGAGATFNIYMPRTTLAIEPVNSLPPPVPVTLRGSETILLVEDDEQVRETMLAILRRYGYQVLDAQNGGEAFLVSEKFGSKIHVLLTDMVMPRMSGRALAARLVSTRPEMKVVYLSGYATASVDALDSTYMLQKPITPESLLRKLREVLNRDSSP